ncbi:hypothetical protein [Aeromonas dhakensis]|uniref:hypothetical protein n=1 Tax=Aeromonas dhakensis TaxID=196024 RepID=UPI00344793EB
MRPYLFCLLTIALLGLLWYLDNLLPTRGWAMQAADGHWTMDGSRSGWGIMREAWPLTLVGFLVSFAITIGLWSVVEKKATDAANQRVADRNNWLSQQESDLEERKNAFLTERATTRAEAVLKLKQAEAERDSAVLKLKQAEATAIADAQAKVDTEKHKTDNRNGALRRISKKGQRQKETQQKTNYSPQALPSSQASAPMVDQSDDPFPYAPTGEAFDALEYLELEAQWLKRQQEKKKKTNATEAERNGTE